MSRNVGFSTMHRRTKARLDGNAARAADQAAFLSASTAGDVIQNKLDIAWLQSLVTWPNLWEASKKALQEAIDYLAAHPTKALHPVFRERFSRIAGVITLEKSGGTYDVTKRKCLPRPGFRKKAPRPAWMSDPSLLPKKPPGRAA